MCEELLGVLEPIEINYTEKAATWSEDYSELERDLHKALWSRHMDIDEKIDSLRCIIQFLQEEVVDSLLLSLHY